MITIRTMEEMRLALASPLDPVLKAILRDRLEVLAEFLADYPLEALAEFVIVQPSDTLAAVEAELRYFSPMANPVDSQRFGDDGFDPAFEWIKFDGFYYQMVFCFADDGWGTHLIVQNSEGVDSNLLLEMCRTYAPAPNAP